jgi:hypothetical protein
LLRKLVAVDPEGIELVRELLSVNEPVGGFERAKVRLDKGVDNLRRGQVLEDLASALREGEGVTEGEVGARERRKETF